MKIKAKRFNFKNLKELAERTSEQIGIVNNESLLPVSDCWNGSPMLYPHDFQPVVDDSDLLQDEIPGIVSASIEARGISGWPTIRFRRCTKYPIALQVSMDVRRDGRTLLEMYNTVTNIETDELEKKFVKLIRDSLISRK